MTIRIPLVFPCVKGSPLRGWLLFWILAFTVGMAQAGSLLLAMPDQDRIAARPYAEYYDEPGATLTANEALEARNLFSPNGTQGLHPDAATRWIRLPIANPSDISLRRVLALGVPDVRYLDVFRTREGRLEQVMSLAPGDPFLARALPRRLMAVPIDLEPGERSEFLLRYNTHGDTPLRLELLTPSRFERDLAQGNLANGAVFGILLALVAFAFLQYMATERIAFLVYTALGAVMMVFLGQFEGYNFEYLWPGQGAWNRQAPIVLVTGFLALQSLFAMTLFETKRRTPRLHRCYQAYLALLTIGMALHGLFDWNWLALAVDLVYVPLALGAGLFFLQRGVPMAGAFLAGTVANLLFSNLLFALSIFGLGIGGNPFLYPKIGYVCEALFFASALGNQMQLLRRRIEDGLRRHLAEAEQLARAETEKHRALLAAQEKQMQLAAASHDLSQPLSSIRLGITALRAQAKSDAHSEAVTRHIDQALDYTESLLRSLIDDAKRDQAEAPHALELETLLGAVHSRHLPAARRKGLAFRYRPTQYRLVASALVLDRILDNLVANAVRYTARGRVLLGVRRRAGGIEIQVHDTGPGIDAADRKRLMAPFAQSGALVEERQGHGLGLHIVRTLCDQSGYRLSLRSRPDYGTTFAVWIPTNN